MQKQESLKDLIDFDQFGSIELDHPAVMEVAELEREKVHYSLEFFFQTFTKDYSGKEPIDTPENQVPPGYFPEPIISVRDIWSSIQQEFLKKTWELRKEIREDFQRKGQEVIGRIESLDQKIDKVKDKYYDRNTCKSCNGRGGSGDPPWQVSQYGDYRWTSDEETNKVHCSDCDSRGYIFVLKAGVNELQYQKELEDLRALRGAVMRSNDELITVCKYGSDVRTVHFIQKELQKRGFKEPSEKVFVYVKIVK